MLMRLNPIRPCKRNLDLILVVIFQVYTENMKYEIFKYGLTPILPFSDFTLFKLH
jgi:hypothetical protein